MDDFSPIFCNFGLAIRIVDYGKYEISITLQHIKR